MTSPESKKAILRDFIPESLQVESLTQEFIPRLAKDAAMTRQIEESLHRIPTRHHFHRADATKMTFLKKNSVHLVVCSPPYWTLKDYNVHEGQLGYVEDYQAFNALLNKVWRQCYHALVPGGRLIINVGDVLLSRRKNNGRHVVVPLHATIQEGCRKIGFDNLSPIIWNKISNAAYEAGGASSFLGKPYEPNAIIKNDIEFILMERKSGGYRSPALEERILSVISAENYQKWFNQIWTGLTGASTRNHPAPYPVELAKRLIRMFSFVGDTVLDPFWGSGTTSLAAWETGRNSIGVELDPAYFKMATERFNKATEGLARPHTELYP